MKLSLSALFLLIGLNAMASPPGTPFPFNSFVPSGGGIKGEAKVFPLTLETADCDKGYSLQLIKSPGLVRRFRFIAQEIYRGACEEGKLDEQLLIHNDLTEKSGADGSMIFTSNRGNIAFQLSDRRYVKADTQPAWVALIDGMYYQASVVTTPKP